MLTVGLFFHSCPGLARLRKAACLALSILLLNACAPFLPSAPPMVPATESLVQPAAYGDLCRRHPKLCALPGSLSVDRRIGLTAPVLKQLRRVNAEVNRTVTYRRDPLIFGRREYWVPADTVGDCEDFALLKLSRLLDQGYPREALRLALAVRPDGRQHAVLAIHTDKGVLIMDNFYNDIVPWHELGYRHWRWEQVGTFRWAGLDANPRQPDGG